MSELKHGMIWWTELASWDIEGAKKFYQNVMGYEIDEMDMGGDNGDKYYTAKIGDMPIVGMFDAAAVGLDKEIPSHWFTYFKVDDMGKTIDDIKNNGGTVIREPFDVPGIGQIAIIAANDGSAFGVGVPAN